MIRTFAVKNVLKMLLSMHIYNVVIIFIDNLHFKKSKYTLKVLHLYLIQYKVNFKKEKIFKEGEWTKILHLFSFSKAR